MRVNEGTRPTFDMQLFVSRIVSQSRISVNSRKFLDDKGDQFHMSFQIVSRIVSRAEFFEVFWMQLEALTNFFDSDFPLCLRTQNPFSPIG